MGSWWLVSLAPHIVFTFPLTLAKGDEVVDVAEEGADGALLGECRDAKGHARERPPGNLQEDEPDA